MPIMTWIAILFGVILITMTIYLCRIGIKQQAIIDRQQDTIQRLINREPVTYKETNTEPPQPIQEGFSAWGNRMLTKEDMNQEP